MEHKLNCIDNDTLDDLILSIAKIAIIKLHNKHSLKEICIIEPKFLELSFDQKCLIIVALMPLYKIDFQPNKSIAFISKV